MTKHTVQLWLTTLILPLILMAACLFEGYRMASNDAADSLLSTSTILLIGGLGAALALLSLVTGAALLLKANRWKSAAQSSRDALLDAFRASQRQMPWFITLLLVSFIGACAVLSTLETIELLQAVMTRGARLSNGFIKLHFLIVLLALGLVVIGINVIWKISRAFSHTSEPMVVNGQLITRAQAPALWQTVDAVAAKLSAPKPHNIIIGMEDGFYVTEHDITLEPTKQSLQGQSLYLSAARMAMFNQDEVLSIIAHELGHFAGADTAYSQYFSPLYAVAIRNHDILNGQMSGSFTDYLGPKTALMLNEYVLDSFHLAISHWSRVREFAADQAGKTIAGGIATASALLRYSTTQPVLTDHYQDITKKSTGTSALIRLMANAHKTALADPSVELKSEIPHPTDTHPPTQERAQALAASELPAAMALASRPIDDAGVRWLSAMIPDFDALYQSIAADHVRNVKEETQAYQAHLNEVISDANVAEITVVYERRSWLMLGFTVLAGLITAVLVYRWAMSLSDAGGSDITALNWSLRCGAATAALGLLTWLMRKLRTNKPLFTLTHHGIESPSFTRKLAWTEIADYDVSSSEINSFTTYTITIKMPVDIDFGLNNGNARRMASKISKDKTQRNLLVTYFGGIKGIKEEAFFTLFNNYYRTAWAKHALLDLAPVEA
jgi:Zn-dependent protease with chaperone function